MQQVNAEKAARAGQQHGANRRCFDGVRKSRRGLLDNERLRCVGNGAFDHVLVTTVRERRDGRRAVKRSHRKLDAERIAQLRLHPHGQNRIAAEPEKTIVAADAGDAQQRLPDFGDALLDAFARRRTACA